MIMNNFILYSVITGCIGYLGVFSYKTYQEICNLYLYKIYMLGYLKALKKDYSNSREIIESIQFLIERMDNLPKNGWINGSVVISLYRKDLTNILLKCINVLEEASKTKYDIDANLYCFIIENNGGKLFKE